MAKILDGRRAADRLLKQIAGTVKQIERPITLATILVGNRFDSALYVKLKTRAATRVGIRTQPYRLPKNVSQARLHELIIQLNRRRSISGILLQLPLPKHLNADYAVSRIHPSKDADGFHPANDQVVSPPVASVLLLHKLANPKRHSTVVILAKPSVFSQALAEELGKQGHAVLIEDAKTRIPIETKKADLVVTARGRGPLLRGIHLKRGAIVIDVGTRRDGKRVVGDADPSVLKVAKAVSPVPGGVGPLTVAFLLYNTVRLARRV